MVIDKDFPGLEERGYYYYYDGSILTNEKIRIDIPLIVSESIIACGSIKAGRWIKAGWWIKAGGSIIAGEWIDAGGSIKAGKSIKAGGSIDVGGSIDAGGSIVFCGVKTKNIFIIKGTLTYSITVLDTHIKIGCQFKTKKEWLKVTTKKQAIGLGDDGSMWENRDFIKSLCI